MIRGKPAAALSGVLCAISTLVSCGSGSTTTSADATAHPTVARSASACEIVSSADLHELTGKSVASGSSQQVVDGISTCSYSTPNLLVRVSKNIGREEADAARKQQHVSKVKGIGDDAYTFIYKSSVTKQRVLSTTQGDTQLYLLSADFTLAQMEKLASIGLGKLQ